MRAVLYLSEGSEETRMRYASRLLLARLGCACDLDCRLGGGREPGLDLGERGLVPRATLEQIFACATLRREVESGRLDEQGRFPEHDLPWDVSEPWIDRLAAELSERGPRPAESAGPSAAGRFRVVVTHDIDEVTGRDPTGLVKSFLRSIGLYRSWPEPSKAISPDQWIANLERLLELEVKNSVGSYYFMLSGPYGLGRYSSRYDSRWAQSKRMAQAILAAGMTVGLHGSYGARERGSYAVEKERLENSIGHPVTCHRNHYLRFDGTRLWDQLEAAGIELDFSIGFNGRIGFRAGLASAYPAWNPVAGRVSTVKTVPLLFSDGALQDGAVRGRLDQLRTALAAVKRCGGCASLLFHPEAFLIEPSLFGIFEEILALCREMGADLSGELPAVEGGAVS